MNYRRYIMIPFLLLIVLLAGCTTQYEQKYEKFDEDEVSFGTLYEILKREGFDVKGNNEQYSFTDASQSTYEIAYPSDDFINADGAANESDQSYVLKNDVSVEREYSYGFGTSENGEMFGLKLYIEVS